MNAQNNKLSTLYIFDEIILSVIARKYGMVTIIELKNKGDNSKGQQGRAVICARDTLSGPDIPV